ncbi:MAG: hypothetical protein K2P38_03975, partial [Lachnospiraceae bacterium]|nr:hypothetical protein [Lachnospiraceae bacterium]
IKFCTSPSTTVLDFIGSVLGSILNRLSMENGQISLIAATAHNKQFTHLGIFLNNSLIHETATIDHPAVILIFNNFKKISPIPITP